MNMQTRSIELEDTTCSHCISGVRHAVGTLDGLGIEQLDGHDAPRIDYDIVNRLVRGFALPLLREE